MKMVASAWDERYSSESFLYGIEPNLFLKENLEKLSTGNILLPAEGEGRNAVFAATQGWGAYAYDLSEVGAKKAHALAQKNNVEINYQVGRLEDLSFDIQFDAIALIFAHFSGENKASLYYELTKLLKPGGTLIFEGFSKEQLAYQAKNPRSGGPRTIDMLFSLEEVKAYFSNFEITQLEEKEVELKEGDLHIGKASVIRFVGIKK